ncbi:MAG: hypothetical protein SNJ75_06100 [Gemmataceae bacterium]
MDYPTQLFLWSLLAAAYFGLLGAVFGSLTAVVNHLDGRAGGSFVGQVVARAFEPLSPLGRALLVGLVDGLLFGGLLGTVVAFVFVPPHQTAWPRLRPIFLGSLAVVGVALLLGSLATRLARSHRVAVAGLSLGGFSGMTIGLATGGVDGLLIGAWCGLVLGSLVGVWLTHRR